MTERQFHIPDEGLIHIESNTASYDVPTSALLKRETEVYKSLTPVVRGYFETETKARFAQDPLKKQQLVRDNLGRLDQIMQDDEMREQMFTYEDIKTQLAKARSKEVTLHEQPKR